MPIILYPMLTASTVNPNIVPGVTKAFEKYTMVYRQDDVFRTVVSDARKYLRIKGKVKMSGGKLQLEGVDEIYATTIESFLQEAYILREADGPGAGAGSKDESERQRELNDLKRELEDKRRDLETRERELRDQKKRDVDTKKAETLRDQAKKDLEKVEKDKNDLYDKKATVKAAPMKNEASLTMEPTYITFETADKGKQFLGLKVVPYTVKSDAALTELLVRDIYLTGLNKFAVSITRKIMRFLYKRWYGLGDKMPWILRKILFMPTTKATVKGVAKHDIIHQRTKMKDVYALVNMMDLHDDFFREAGNVNKLFSLGWNSLAIDDQVNKRVVFCTKEYKGMCTVVPYQFLYSSLGRDAATAFESIEDVKKSAGPMFRLSGRLDKMVKEDLATEKLNYFTNDSDYSLLIDEHLSLVSENIQNKFKNVNMVEMKKVITGAVSALKQKDVGKLKKVFAKYSDSNIPTAFEKMANKKYGSEFIKSSRLAKRILDNSLPDYLEKVNGPMATLIVMTAVSRNKGIDKNVFKNNLNTTVKKIRTSLKKKDNVDVDAETWQILILTGLAISFLGKALFDIGSLLSGLFNSIVSLFSNIGSAITTTFGKAGDVVGTVSDAGSSALFFMGVVAVFLVVLAIFDPKGKE